MVLVFGYGLMLLVADAAVAWAAANVVDVGGCCCSWLAAGWRVVVDADAAPG